MADPTSFIVKLPYSSSVASAICRATQAALSKHAREAAASSEQTARPKITAYFTQSQLALAVAIQKAKPEALPTNGQSAITFCHFPG
jgi:hypothetical protein